MELTTDFWKLYELDIALVKVIYLKWAIDYMKPPSKKMMSRFLWDDQQRFHVVNSRYGRSFSQSPFGSVVQGVPKFEIKGEPPRGHHMATSIKNRLSLNTGLIRQNIHWLLNNNQFYGAKNAILNWYWMKIGPHELLFDNVHQRENDDGILERGKWALDESEKWHTLTGIRNRIVNVCRFGEPLELQYVRSLNKKLPGFTEGSYGTFLSSGMTWNRYGMCAFDCGPVLWSKSGFVQFSQVAARMKKLGWPYYGTPRQILTPFYCIALDYKRYPIRVKHMSEEGYTLFQMRKRRFQILEKLEKIMCEINRLKKELEA